MEYKKRNIDTSQGSQLTQLNTLIPLNFQVRYSDFLGAVLEAMPWVGSYKGKEQSQSHTRPPMIYKIWEDAEKRQVTDFGNHINDIFSRFDGLYENISKRLTDPGYLNIVNTAFSLWSFFREAEKIRCIKNLIVNAAATRLCSDEILIQLVKWLSDFQAMHFNILKEMKQNSIMPYEHIEKTILKGKGNSKTPEAYYCKSALNDLIFKGLIEKDKEKSAMFLTSLGSQLIYYSMETTVRRIE